MKIYQKKTFSLRNEDVKRKWILIDAEGQVLGRLATEIATLLIGKGKPTYTGHIDGGDYVVVINAAKVVVTGRKEEDKTYYRHSNYPGAMRQETVAERRARRPEAIVEAAVKNMIPKNKLRQDRLARLKIFATEEHPYANEIAMGEKLVAIGVVAAKRAAEKAAKKAEVVGEKKVEKKTEVKATGDAKAVEKKEAEKKNTKVAEKKEAKTTKKATEAKKSTKK